MDYDTTIQKLVADSTDQPLFSVIDQRCIVGAILGGCGHPLTGNLGGGRCAWGRFPGRALVVTIAGDDEARKLSKTEEKVIVYDEAHCIPTWGVEFRPALLSIHEWVTDPTNVQVILMSATISEVDIDFIKKAFRISIDNIITDLHIRGNFEYSLVDISRIFDIKTVHTLIKNPASLVGLIDILFQTPDHLSVLRECEQWNLGSPC
ncbi:unnamed protein product [Bemisia tabaci]|uniref:Helicase ATP-binding domain-containing protein n=1 Tax=Bemisia tabaci TaxID=7038 RepID=A0A9P0F8R9_BEMTA|nr:unnamed protein product [Bemisia tabaci]